MILVDTSVWVDHLRSSDRALTALLNDGQVLSHPYVIAELALGNLRQRNVVLGALTALPTAPVASDGELLHFIEQNALTGTGIGFVDAHLLAATRLGMTASLWTRDKRLQAVATRLHLAMI